MKLTKEYCSSFCKDNNIETIPSKNDWGIYQYSYNMRKINNLQETLFMTGIGMNNVPHLMTLAQLVGINDLSSKGFNTRIILGDYDVILARDKDLSTNNIVGTYKNFIQRIGFKQEIIEQSKFQNRLDNLIHISKYIEREDLTYVREDILNYYNTPDTVALDLSYILMFSDLLIPIISGAYKYVVMCCGLDESKYSITANKILHRMGVKGEIGGLYTFIPENGLNGWPQMSKSHPDSAIFLTDSLEQIHIKFKSKPNYINFAYELGKKLMPNTHIEESYQVYGRLIKCIEKYASEWMKSESVGKDGFEPPKA